LRKWTVSGGCGDKADVPYLHQCSLDLTICAGALREPTATNGVDLVHENDTRLVLACVPEHLADDTGRLANVLVHNGRGDNLKEVGLQGGGDSTSEECLSSSGRAVEEDALRRSDAYTLEQLGAYEREFNNLVD
jgi:hypothetical protein